MDWDDLRIFLAVARTGSIRAAAQTLHVNHSTVSRRITAFEQKIGVRLFDRLPQGYALTPIGEEMVESAELIEEEVGKLDRKVIGRDAQLSGVLRVTMPGLLASHLLMPDLSMFSQIYPGIKLELAISSEEFDLKKREADVAIRITSNPPEYLVGRFIGRGASAIYASHRYLEKHDPVNKPGKMNWLGWEDTESQPAWVKESQLPKAHIYHQMDDPYAQLEAVKAGLGVAKLPCFMADPVAEVRRVFPQTNYYCGDIWILTHKDLRSTARVRRFIEFMVKALERHEDVLLGRMVSKDEEILPVGSALS